MILLSRAVRVYFATQPTNLRLSFEGLTNQIRNALGHDPLSGHVFVFLHRRRNQVKLILWTRGGFTIVQKRLERGTFTLPKQLADEQADLHKPARPPLSGVVVRGNVGDAVEAARSPNRPST